jgi:alpha-L-fucosidase
MNTNAAYEVEDTGKARLQASPEGLKRFQESCLGLSVHWGLYALFSRNNEWIYFNERIPLDAYKKMMQKFNPIRFQAEEWADLLLEAGLKFLLITSKHHDGFCLWNTDLTDFKITNTPFGRDALRELADALRHRGLGLHFYYSLVDWTHPAYRRDWPAYVDYYQGQIRELCTRFGEISGIIFDGYWPRQEFRGDHKEYFAARGPWDLAGTYDLIHSLQPHAVVSNNTHIPPLKGEDYQVWELDLPGENTIGFNCTEIGDKPTASWWNINVGWSYQPWHHAVKSVEEVYKIYQAVHEKNAVFFLNVGPRPFGDIHPEEQTVLRQLGSAIRMGGAL